MEPITYRVGDIVKVKSNMTSPINYPFMFTKEMCEAFGGKLLEITAMELQSSSVVSEIKTCKHYNGDNYKYRLKGNIWDWHSSMFEPMIEGSKLNLCIKGQIFSGHIEKESISGNYYLNFSSDTTTHPRVCDVIQILVPNFNEWAKLCGAATYSGSILFPEFISIAELIRFVLFVNKGTNDNILLDEEIIKTNVSPIKINKNGENAIKFQRAKSSIMRGNVPKGYQIRGRKHQITICSGYLNYRTIHC